MKVFRIYGSPSCSFCTAAKDHLLSLGVPEESVEAIEIGDDPILQSGLRSVTGTLLYPMPVTVCFPATEVVVGFKPEELSRLVDYCQRLGAIPYCSPASAG